MFVQQLSQLLPLHLLAAETMIEVKDLTYYYQNRSTPVLKDISLNIRNGEFVIIAGRSGCGKSTLSYALSGFIPNSLHGKMKGDVLINGNNTKEMELADISTQVGLIQQDPESQLVTLRVEDEVAFGPENLKLSPSEIRERVNWSLEVVGASHLIDREIYTLSGGEKQRIAIASILAMKPKTIILDEPTSNLDPKGVLMIFNTLKRLIHEYRLTVVLVEHRLNMFLPLADRIIFMDRGRIIDTKLKEDVNSEYIQQFYNINSYNYEKSHIYNDPFLTIRNLHFKYENKEVLKGVNLEIKRNEVIALMGDNGAGKTTLLLNIMGILKPEQGEIIYHKLENGKYTSKLARHIGYIFQNPNHQIFENTVWNEVLLSPRNFGILNTETEDRAEYLLRHFNLERYRDNSPFTLSYGEKRRLNIAAVEVYLPEMMILDEPFIGQDPENIAKLSQIVNEYVAKGGTILMVSHDLNLSKRIASRIVYMEDGAVRFTTPVQNAEDMFEEYGLDHYTRTSVFL